VLRLRKKERERMRNEKVMGTHANGTTLGIPSVLVGPYPDPDSYPSICRSHPHPDLRVLVMVWAGATS
jgi:hypothetical protein